MQLFESNYEILKAATKGNIESIEGDETGLQLVEDEDCVYISEGYQSLYGVINKRSTIDKLNVKKNQVIIIVGISGLKYLEAQLLSMPQQNRVIIIEPNKNLFRLELENYNLDFLKNIRASIYCDELDGLDTYLEEQYTGQDIYILGNLIIHINSVYESKTEETKKILGKIKESFNNKLFSLGNSIDDSLIGLRQNMQNLNHICESKAVGHIKGLFKNVPAIVVAAGPSLEKNIHLLKEVQESYVIVAVDTIVPRLLEEGITPHFICSVERIQEVYDYFYKEKNYPKEITLVGPPLLRKEIFNEFEGEKILPLRQSVGEYMWLREVLGLDEEDEMYMGISCAHVAFGIAVHLGCNPITLIGQDLAYGEKDSHVKGTIYDEIGINDSNNEVLYTKGYYGEEVRTTKVWQGFKFWYERYIQNLDRKIINATEGGVSILHTIQMPLQEVIKSYPSPKIEVAKIIQEQPRYQINVKEAINNIEQTKLHIQNMSQRIQVLVSELRKSKIHKKNGGNLHKVRNKLLKTDKILNEIIVDPLLMHIYQSHIVTKMWKYNELEFGITEESIKNNIGIQIELWEPIIFANKIVIECLQEGIDSLKGIK